jgi:hypothetical protein
MLGIEFYRGASELDGAPIVAVATIGRSLNRKTGDMLQTWIMRADVAPVAAQASGADGGVCGDCPLRPILSRGTGRPGCYVNVGQAPAGVWNAWKRGRYSVAGSMDGAAWAEARRIVGGRSIRWGAYGDPAAVPEWAWLALQGGLGHPANTGYTHAWRNPGAAWLRFWCMASADSADDAAKAHAAGWRTFRVRRASEASIGREIACPAESGRTTCSSCMLCGGARERDGRPDARANIMIMAHGARTPAAWLEGGAV